MEDILEMKDILKIIALNCIQTCPVRISSMGTNSKTHEGIKSGIMTNTFYGATNI